MQSRVEALKVMPKKPINAYFKFRANKLNQYKDYPNRSDMARQAWNDLTQKEKKDMEDAYQNELAQYRHDFQKWKEEYEIEPDFKPNNRKKVEVSKEESTVEGQKFAIFKKESIDCYLRLNKLIKDQLRKQKSKFSDLSDNQANKYIQQYQHLCYNLQETIYNESNFDQNSQ